MLEDSAVIRDLAPYGPIRVAVNLGNPSVVTRDAANDELRGIAIDLSQSLAEDCNLPVEYVTFASAGQLIEAGVRDSWDVAFLAVDDRRRAQLCFTPPYMQIQGQIMVRIESPIQHWEEIDKPGSRVSVTAGSAYDSFLTMTLKSAEIFRYVSSKESFAALLRGEVHAAAGVTLALREFASRFPGVRILDRAFMVIDQAMAIHIGRAAGAKYLVDFVSKKLGNELSHG